MPSLADPRKVYMTFRRSQQDHVAGICGNSSLRRPVMQTHVSHVREVWVCRASICTHACMHDSVLVTAGPLRRYPRRLPGC